MSLLGIYFGSKTINITETKGKKVLNNLTIIPPSVSGASELQDSSDAEIKAIEIIALFKSELRRNKISANEAILCLPGKDMIIRTFEMPVMPKNELYEAVYFEAKKYIPFKIDELVSDYQAELNKATKTNTVLFMGIKKDVLDRYLGLLGQLNIKAVAVEFSAFSVQRSFKVAGINEAGIIGILEVDLNSEEEINFTILENGFPLFSRDISLSTGMDMAPEEAAGVGAGRAAAALDKLKTELRVSLDYYHRKYPVKNIKKIYFNCNAEYRAELEAFLGESGLSGNVVDLARIIGKELPYSTGLIRSYSASLHNAVSTKIKANVLAVKMRQKQAKEKVVFPEIAALFEGIKLDFRIIILGVLICASAFAFGFYKVRLARQELGKIVKQRPAVTSVRPGLNYQELNSRRDDYRRKLDNLENLIKSQLRTTIPLDVIPKVTPTGLWLTEFSLNNESQDRAELVLRGTVFLADSDKEFEAVNTFVSKLKGDPGFSSYFRNIKLDGFDRVKEQELTVAKFSVNCKAR